MSGTGNPLGTLIMLIGVPKKIKDSEYRVRPCALQID
jgi:hypothetical protein